jgi:hypothetical protein
MSSGLMSRFLRFLAVLSLGALLVRGEGADDAYIRIYNLLQQADANSGAGRRMLAGVRSKRHGHVVVG